MKRTDGLFTSSETGGLFRMAAKLLIAESGSSEMKPPDFDKLMTLLGRYFQIRDDYMNLASAEVGT